MGNNPTVVADLLKVSGKKTSYDNDVTLCKQHNVDNFVMGASFALLPDDDWFADSRITVTCFDTPRTTSCHYVQVRANK